MKELSVIIPVYNEGNILVQALDTIIEEVRSIESLEGFEIIVIDDGSQDNTWDLLTEQLCQTHPEIHAIKLARNFGKESALCAGLEITDAKATVIMDGDLQHPPSVINEMLEIWRDSSVDVVEAVKRSRGNEPTLSKLAANSFYALFNWLSGFDLKNASDFKLLDKRVVVAWRELPEKNLFFRGMSAWLGFNRKEIEFEVAPRLDSGSKWSTFGRLSLAFTSIAAFSSAPLHLITLAGLIFILFATVLGIIALTQYFSGVAVSGFATVILLLLIIGGIMMISLGIIGEYLAKIYDEVKARPRYVIADHSKKQGIEQER